MRKTACAVLAVFFLALVPAAADQKPRVAPPPLRVEAPTLQPSPAHVWVPGYWKWKDINYEWVDGRWVKAKPNRAWVPGMWEQQGSYWVWKPGKWTKIAKDEPKAEKKGN